MAIAVHAEMSYSVVQCGDGLCVIVARERLEALAGAGIFGETWKILGELSGKLALYHDKLALFNRSWLQVPT
jgi:isoleucyl-tRNA synthetase